MISFQSTKILWTCIFLLFWAYGSAQERVIQDQRSQKILSIDPGEVRKRTTEQNVYFPTFGDECTFELVTLAIDNQWGRVSGMNGFGDREKAQTLTFDGHPTYRIVGAMVWFERPSVVGDGTLVCKIYTPHAEDGRPDRLIGQSDAVKVSEIIPADSVSYPTFFSFESGATILPDEPKFILSCDFRNLYNTFDTAWLLQTIDGCGDGGDTWELFSDGQTWTHIASSTSWELNSDFVMAAVVDFEDPTSDGSFIQHENLTIYPPKPNPAQDEINLHFHQKNSEVIDLKIFDQDGMLIDHLHLGIISAGEHFHTINISHLSSGIYYYKVGSGKDAITSRFVVGS